MIQTLTKKIDTSQNYLIKQREKEDVTKYLNYYLNIY